MSALEELEKLVKAIALVIPRNYKNMQRAEDMVNTITERALRKIQELKEKESKPVVIISGGVRTGRNHARMKTLVVNELDNLTHTELGKLYKHIRRDLIANIEGREKSSPSDPSAKGALEQSGGTDHPLVHENWEGKDKEFWNQVPCPQCGAVPRKSDDDPFYMFKHTPKEIMEATSRVLGGRKDHWQDLTAKEAGECIENRVWVWVKENGKIYKAKLKSYFHGEFPFKATLEKGFYGDFESCSLLNHKGESPE